MCPRARLLVTVCQPAPTPALREAPGPNLLPLGPPGPFLGSPEAVVPTFIHTFLGSTYIRRLPASSPPFLSLLLPSLATRDSVTHASLTSARCQPLSVLGRLPTGYGPQPTLTATREVRQATQLPSGGGGDLYGTPAAPAVQRRVQRPRLRRVRARTATDLLTV